MRVVLLCLLLFSQFSIYAQSNSDYRHISEMDSLQMQVYDILRECIDLKVEKTNGYHLVPFYKIEESNDVYHLRTLYYNEVGLGFQRGTTYSAILKLEKNIALKVNETELKTRLGPKTHRTLPTPPSAGDSIVASLRPIPPPVIANPTYTFSVYAYKNHRGYLNSILTKKSGTPFFKKKFLPDATFSTGRTASFIDTTLFRFNIEDKNVRFIDKNKVILRRNGMYGMVNTQNQILIPFEYESIQLINAGILAKKDQKWFFVDEQNNILSDMYSRIDHLYGHIDNESVFPIRVWHDEQGVNFIDSSFNTILRRNYERVNGLIFGSLQDGFLFAERDSKYVLIDIKKGKELKTKYDEFMFINDEPNVSSYKTGGKFGLLGVRGNKIKRFVKPIYDSLSFADENILVVDMGGRKGAINYLGDVIIPIKYDSLDCNYRYRNCKAILGEKEKRYLKTELN